MSKKYKKISSNELKDNKAISPDKWDKLPQEILNKHAEIRKENKGFFGIAKHQGKHFIVKRGKNGIGSYDIVWEEE